MIKQLKYILLISITLFASSCNGQKKKEIEKLITEKVEPYSMVQEMFSIEAI